MANDIIQTFTNEIFGNVRTLNINGEPWFVATDIAKVLGYSDATHMTRNIIDPRDKGLQIVETPGGPQNLSVINESGLYNAIFSSKLPAAIEFKHWVTSVVLPTMRQIGFSRSMQVLQNENIRLQNENKYLNNQLAIAGDINTSQSINNMDNLYSIYYVLNNPYISDDMKRAMLTYDLSNREIDLKSEIQKKVNYLFKDEQED